MVSIEGEFMANVHSALVLLELDRADETSDFLQRALRNMPDEHPLRPDLMKLVQWLS